MYFKEINEELAVDFTKELLGFYKEIDDGCVDTILTHKDPEARRDNVGWYGPVDSQHKIFINIPNILCARFALERGVIDYDCFYAFLALITGHEFRHFLQGRVIYDGQEIEGFTSEDAFNADLMKYIRYFFDAYYLLNKGNIKYEVDAEKFSVINGVKYLKDRYPRMDAEKSMLDAVNYYASAQARGGVLPTLPLGCKSIDEAIGALQNRIERNERISNLDKSLFVHLPWFYQNHAAFGLDEDRVITKTLLQEYFNEKSGTERDLMVVKRIISLLEHPEESFGEFPLLRKRYKENSL